MRLDRQSGCRFTVEAERLFDRAPDARRWRRYRPPASADARGIVLRERDGALEGQVPVELVPNTEPNPAWSHVFTFRFEGEALTGSFEAMHRRRRGRRYAGSVSGHSGESFDTP